MKDRKTVTLSDIAEVLHLSPTVISMVLNGKARKYRVSEEVERKVMHCAREMGYRPNRLAQSLRTGKIPYYRTHFGRYFQSVFCPYGPLYRERSREV